MNPKLEKYIVEKERNQRRIEALRVRNEKLDTMIAEMQSLELNSLLRGANMSYQELTAYIQSKAGQDASHDKKREGNAHGKKTAHGQAPAQDEAAQEEQA